MAFCLRSSTFNSSRFVNSIGFSPFHFEFWQKKKVYDSRTPFYEKSLRWHYPNQVWSKLLVSSQPVIQAPAYSVVVIHTLSAYL